MITEERKLKLKNLITCMKCEVSGKVCDANCPTQYDAGNMGEIIENFEWISKLLEQESKPMEKFESVKDHIFKLASDYKCWDNRLTHDEALELCHILEQEPCEDCISRKAALDMATTIQTDDYSGNEVMEVVDIDEIKALPPVTPTRKKGKWIVLKDGYGDIVEAVCSCCHANGNHKWRCCPYCESKMEVEE